MDLRGLPGGAPARDRRRRASRQDGVGAGLLEPRRAVTPTSRRRATRSSRRPAQPRRRVPARLRRRRLLELRSVRVQGRDRYLVRGAAGRRCRRARSRLDPKLSPDQVEWLLERTAATRTRRTAAAICPKGRDSLTGWGTLDVAAALERSRAAVRCRPPTRSSRTTTPASWRIAFGPAAPLSATLDFWDDPVDVYAITLRQGDELFARLSRRDAGADGARALEAGHAPRDRQRRSRRRPRCALDERRRAAAAELHRARVAAPTTSRCGRRADPRRRRVRARARDAGKPEPAARTRLEQLLRRDLAEDAGRIADDQRPRRDVLRHDGAGADERLLADLDRRAEDGAGADPRAAPDRRPRDQVVAPLGPAHEVVVRGDHARCDEDVLLERRVRRDVGAGLDLRQRPTVRVVLDQRAAAEDDVVADGDPLADAGLVAEDHARADRRAGEDDGAGRDDRPVADLGRRRAARASPSSAATSVGCLPTTAPSRIFTPSPSTVPGYTTAVSCTSGAAIRGVPGRAIPAAARARGRRRARRAPRRRLLPSRTSRRKWDSSSRRGSSVAIFGLRMSPVRVCHSPKRLGRLLGPFS